MIFSGQSLQYGFVQHWISELRVLLAQRNEAPVLAHMRGIVPEYQPGKKWAQSSSAGEMRAAVGA
jgi:hypothetical protein